LHDEFEDTRVVAVWDGGSVRPPGYAHEFAQQFGVEQVPETLDEMVEEMVAHDMEQAKRHALLKQNGYAVSVSREN